MSGETTVPEENGGPELRQHLVFFLEYLGLRFRTGISVGLQLLAVGLVVFGAIDAYGYVVLAAYGLTIPGIPAFSLLTDLLIVGAGLVLTGLLVPVLMRRL